jgi:DNA polymerase-2
VAEKEQAVGFIVHAFTRNHGDETQLCLTGRLETAETFAAILNKEKPSFFVRSSEAASAERLLRGAREGDRTVLNVAERTTIDGEPCVRVTFQAQNDLIEGLRSLQGASIRTYEADIRLPDAFLIDNAVHGSVRLLGEWTKGKRVDRVYLDPDIAPADWTPQLSIASIDIETNPYGSEIYAISTYFRSYQGEVVESVLLALPEDHDRVGEREGLTALAAGEFWTLIVCDDERELLQTWTDQMVELDPDLITGWNVAGFDFERIFARLQHHRMAFRIGRSGEAGTFFPAAPGKPPTVVIPGRQVLDAMRIARSGPQRFPDHSLETVAQEVLGRGKTIDAVGTREKLRQIAEMYRSDPLSLCRYCLEDARLVIEILDRTGLLDLTLQRSLLIGVPLSRAWTSIAAFDFVYIEAMHRRGIVAPTLGVDPLPMESALGGAIISPDSGLFDNVLVFDFKSLYPSLIRTFNIDPLSYAGRVDTGTDLIRAPNGACFTRGEAILPALLGRYTTAREAAKHRGDATAAYVYKILMNSFYGVLGASGCRFAGSDLAGAITGFGQQLLYWCRDLLEEAGHRTLYGDTDSLFVQSNLPRGSDDDALQAVGGRLCRWVNEKLAEHLDDAYSLETKMELEFEKVYLRFFIPPLRGQSGGRMDREASIQRGRAKGYAGYLHSRSPGVGESSLEVKGMEAVRRDWTDAAKELQLTLLRMLFEDVAAREIVEYLHRYVASMRRGELDSKLVYAKALRKPVSHYTASSPPHVQAARLLDPMDQTGVIHYLWTTAGPQPRGAIHDPVDYQHYLEKQLKPIAGTFSELLGFDLEAHFDADRQLNLF